MLFAVTFRAKPGREAEFEKLINDPEAGRAFARAAGATRNTLFLKGGRMIRVLEFPEGAAPVPMEDVLRGGARLRAFVERLGELIEDGPDPGRPESLESFNERVSFPLAYDVRP